MALVSDKLVSADTGDLYTNQLQIVQAPGGHTTASFATGAVTLKAGHPLAFAGGVYKPFVAADVSVAAFVWPDDIVLDATDSATGEVMLKGEIRKFSEVNALLAGADQTAFLLSCTNELTAKGIIVREIPNINQ